MYVDEILLTGSSLVLIHNLIDKLHHKSSLKKLGNPENFLGYEVTYHAQGLMVLSHSKSIKDVLQGA